MKRKSYFYLMSLLIIVFLLSACSSQKQSGATDKPNAEGSSQPKAGPVDIHIWGGSPGGSYEPLMVAVGECFKKGIEGSVITNEPVGGSSAISAVAMNKGQLGLGMAVNVGQLYNGKPPFPSANKDIRMIMVLFPSVNQIAVNKSSGINNIEQIKGKRVNVGGKGLVTEILANTVMNQYGISSNDVKIQNLGFSDAVTQMIDGHLDVDFMTGAFPKSDFINLANSIDMNLLSLSKEVVDRIVKENPGVVSFTIPAGAYKGVNSDILTISAPTVFITNSSVPDDLVYNMTKQVFNNMNQLGQVLGDMKKVTEEGMIQDLGVPFHPGAIQFYKEKGLWK